MLVSVIMPVKNAENTIIQAIESILQQTFTDLELIIIDNHSTDSTAKLIKEVADTRIILVSNKGNAIAAALNMGIELAKGEYIARMAADDISMPVRLEKKQWQFAHKNPQYDVISCLVAH
jgi:glycosyltransferase involved in cell wall biosynthesis